jgi:hypothetical protein
MKREIITKRLIIIKWLTGMPFMLTSIMNMPQSITLRRIRIIILSILNIRRTDRILPFKGLTKVPFLF